MAAPQADLEALRSLAQGPQDPEPPRESRVVNLVMKVAAERPDEAAPHHQADAPGEEKIAWEQKDAMAFWRMAGDLVDPRIFEGKRILDVGCGWGGKAIAFAQAFAPEHIVGFDLPGVFDPSVPTRVAERLGLRNCEFTVAQGETVPFGDDSFDLCFIDDVLEHVGDPEGVLRECKRVLRPGGLVVAKLPSIKMAGAHHFDRATRLPGLHYLMPMRTWAAGFNHYLLTRANGNQFEPFSRVVDTEFKRGVTSNLNGMDFKDIGNVVRRAGLEPRILEMTPYPSTAFTGRFGPRLGRLLHRLYLAVRRGPLREPLSVTVVVVAEA